MDIALGFLTFGTIGFVAAFAYVSARVTEKRRQENRPPSSLAAVHPRWTPETARRRA